MQKSGRNNPCPSCGRQSDGDCRWSTDVIFCHQGSSHGPDQSLAVGDTVVINGAVWALVKRNGGFDGAADVLKPHREQNLSRSVRRVSLLNRRAKRSIAALALERFFDAFTKAWNVRDFHTLPPDQLETAFAAISHAATIGNELAITVDSIWREHHDLRDIHKERFNSCLNATKLMVADSAHFRQHYLGHPPTEAWG